MTKKYTIAILFHENNNPRNVKTYSITYSGKLWQEQGHKVIYLFGVNKIISADICIVHVDLSIVPEEYLEFANRFPVSMNAKTRDIRKSSFSKNLLSRDDEYDEAVIVKTVLTMLAA